jgi:hypothetical protein
MHETKLAAIMRVLDTLDHAIEFMENVLLEDEFALVEEEGDGPDPDPGEEMTPEDEPARLRVVAADRA